MDIYSWAPAPTFLFIWFSISAVHSLFPALLWDLLRTNYLMVVWYHLLKRSVGWAELPSSCLLPALVHETEGAVYCPLCPTQGLTQLLTDWSRNWELDPCPDWSLCLWCLVLKLGDSACVHVAWVVEQVTRALLWNIWLNYLPLWVQCHLWLIHGPGSDLTNKWISLTTTFTFSPGHLTQLKAIWSQEGWGIDKTE